MTVLLKKTAQYGSYLLIALLASTPALAQDAERPDLQGIWTNASLTKLTRPSGVDSLIVTAEQAQIIA
ncbi:MAG: hypothetical protein HN872_04995, partial [Gammaproteobacteria bacterium]|nr:hypothetical protein [Gammaproteobacteria bacterium]